MEETIDRQAAILEATSSAYQSDKIELERKILELENSNLQAQLDADEKRDIISMRRRWSNWLLFALLLIMAFDMILVALVGFKVWTFAGNTLPLIVIDSLVKIIGLALIVVNFLFNKDSLTRKQI